MSDAPYRSNKGLAPRGATPDFSRLQRRNRINPATAAPPAPAELPPVEAALPDLVRPAALVPSLVSVERERVTTYLDVRLRARAREAYRATSHLEGDKSWSDFVERAILAEVRHNGGQVYAGDQTPLSPGRPQALREVATALGLTRKAKGVFRLTSAGEKLRHDPASLWAYVA